MNNIIIGKQMDEWDFKDGQDEKITVVSYTRFEGVMFSNGITIKDFHNQDWCESVYADWSSLDDTGFLNQEFYQIELEFVPEVGFRINGYTVHCYNSQNGYYSSDLQLIIEHNGEAISTFDISDFVEDDIDWYLVPKVSP